MQRPTLVFIKAVNSFSICMQIGLFFVYSVALALYIYYHVICLWNNLSHVLSVLYAVRLVI